MTPEQNTTPSPTSVATPPAQTSTSKSNGCLKWFLIGVGILIILGIIGGISAYLLTAAPTDVARSFVTDVSQNQMSQAYALTSPSFQQSYTLDKFMTTFTNASTIKSVSFNSRNRTNDNAVISGSITSNDGSKIPVSISLTEDKGSWKVVGYHFGN